MSDNQKAMTISDFIRSKGLTVKLIAQKLGVRQQTIYQYGLINNPTEKTYTKIAAAMTALGVPTTVVDIYNATH